MIFEVINFQLKWMRKLERIQAWPGIIPWPLHYWLQGKLYLISRLWKQIIIYFSLQDSHSFEFNLFAKVYNVSTPKLTLSDGLSSSANFLPQMLLPLLPVPVLNNNWQSRTEVNLQWNSFSVIERCGLLQETFLLYLWGLQFAP